MGLIVPGDPCSSLLVTTVAISHLSKCKITQTHSVPDRANCKSPVTDSFSEKKLCSLALQSENFLMSNLTAV